MRKLNLRSRRGSTAVFLCVILSALIMLSFAMIWSAREHSINSRVDALMNLAGESLMSEFHRTILSEYGLFMLCCDGGEMSRKLRYYVNKPLSSSRGVSVSDATVDASRYTIVDPEPIREQIIDYMRSGGIGIIAGKDKAPKNPAAYHSLRHGPTVISLPSRQLPEKDLFSMLGKADHLKDISGVFTGGTQRFLLGSYILGTFNNCGGIADEDHFFHNEVEYIICGKLSDEDNEKSIIRTIQTLRFPSNLAHIYTNAGKMAELTAAAEAIAPGPVGLAIQAALGAAWAWAESGNDARLLIEGYSVPLVKDSSTWALDMDSILTSLVSGALDPERFSEGSYGDDPEKMLKKGMPLIRPAVDKGLNYEQYLRILLFMKEDPQTVMRILDLIQINMRKDHDGSFLICEQCLGLSMEIKVNGRSFSYDKTY